MAKPASTSTYVVKIKEEDPIAEERFVYVTYDHEKARITWVGREFTEPAIRADLKKGGMPPAEIDAEIERARKNPSSANTGFPESGPAAVVAQDALIRQNSQ